MRAPFHKGLHPCPCHVAEDLVKMKNPFHTEDELANFYSLLVMENFESSFCGGGKSFITVVAA